MKDRERMKEKFNHVALDYDLQRKRLLPCFDDFYGLATDMASQAGPVASILDIGAGTGLFSAYLLEKFPRATFTLIDLSEQMINEAKKRFQNYSNFNYILADYSTYSFPNRFDLVVSSLSIHHLEHPEKQSLFQTIYDLLNQHGLFINADQVSGSTAAMDQLYKETWESKVRSSSLDEEAIQAAIERRKLDINAPLHSQLKWLEEAGFTEVDCIYKYYEFAVMVGRKTDL